MVINTEKMSERMTYFVSGLKSKNEEVREKTAFELQRYVATELREVSANELSTFFEEFNKHIIEMVRSSDVNEKKGGIYAIVSLVEVEGQTEQRIARLANHLRNLFNSPEPGVIELTAKAVGRLALASGTFTAEYVDNLVKKSFEWLQGDRNELRRFAAVLVLRELALSVPTYFFQEVQQFLDLIFNAVRDPKLKIRESAVAALQVALAITSQRETKEIQQPMWYEQCLSRVWDGFGDNSPQKDRLLSREDCIHGSLLVLNELLRCSNNEWELKISRLRHLTHYQAVRKADAFEKLGARERSLSVLKKFRHIQIIKSNWSHSSSSVSPLTEQSSRSVHVIENNILENPSESRVCKDLLLKNYDTACTYVITQFSSKVNFIQSALLRILPRLAALDNFTFSTRYLGKTMNYLRFLLRGKEKDTIFIALGLVCIAVGSNMKDYLPNILESLKASLPSKETPVRKRIVEPSVHMCISLVARSCNDPLEVELRPLIEPMLSGGLSPPLMLALEEVALKSSKLMREIAESLLRIVSPILIQWKSTSQVYSGHYSILSSHSFESYNIANTVLALKALGTFNFEGTRQPLMPFVKFIADVFLTHENREIRLQAIPACCHLLRPAFVTLAPNTMQWKHPQAHTVFEIITKISWVCIIDEDPEVRQCVLSSLDCTFDSHLAQPENIKAFVFALNDEVSEIQELAISVLGRLSTINPAYIHPVFRKEMLKIIDDLEFSGVIEHKERSARMLGHLVSNVPTFMPPFVPVIMSSLVPKLTDPYMNPAVMNYILNAVCYLAQVSGIEVKKWLDKLLPVLLDMLNDSSSGWKREVALVTFGQLIENTGYVHPYTEYPTLLDDLLSFLKTEQKSLVRKETIRVLGLLGALDPYKHKLNIGTIRIQNDIGVTVIATGDIGDDSSGDLGPSEMLVSRPLGCTSLDTFYPDCAIETLLKIIKHTSLAKYHNDVIWALTFIFESLGLEGVSYVPRVVRCLLMVIKTCEDSCRDYLFQELTKIITIFKLHILHSVSDIVNFLKEFCITGILKESAVSIIAVVESIAVSIGPDFKIYIRDLMPMILKSFINDNDEKLMITKLLLKALQKFGSTLEEGLHMVLPHIVKLFDATNVPMDVRETAIETVSHFANNLDLTDFSSRIIHPLLRAIDSTPELRSLAMTLLCSMAMQLGRSYEGFIPRVHKILTKHEINNDQYDIIVAKVLEGLPLIDDRTNMATNQQTFYHSVRESAETDSVAIRRGPVGMHSLQNAWSLKRLVSKDDWLEWLRRFSIELIKASPSPALKACYKVAASYQQLAKELFNPAFVSCWSTLHESLQNDLLNTLREVLTKQDIPEITQTLLNLAEFMEHCDQGPLPLELNLLGEKAMSCRAFAKALHYKEEEFHKNPSPEVLEQLISINNKLGQKEAAASLLEYALKHHKKNMKGQERWYEKLHDWEQALKAYEAKLEKQPQDFEYVLGQMRCLEALGNWDELSSIAYNHWSSSATDEKKINMARVAAASAWVKEQWDLMEEYTNYIPKDTQEGSFYRAIIAVHNKKFKLAYQFIEGTRDLLDTELTAMVGESYQRAYSSMISVQMLAELEEVIQYMSIPERRQHIKQMWWERLQGCQKVVEDWQKILHVRSLVLTPQDDTRPWLKFASLCRKSGRLNLTHETLVKRLGCEPSVVFQPNFLLNNPHVVYHYYKYIHEYPERRVEAYENLHIFLSKLSPIVNNNHTDVKFSRELVSKVNLKLGEWYEQLYGISEQSIATVLAYYTNAKNINDTSYKAWHAYAYMNFEAIGFYKKEMENESEFQRMKVISDFASAAVKGFIRSVSLSAGQSLQDTLRLLTVWFEHGHLQNVSDVLVEGLKAIPIDNWLQVIPQLIARIDTSRKYIAKLIHKLLTDIGQHHPQALIYPLTVASKAAERSRSCAAEMVLKNMMKHSERLVQQAMMVSEELNRVVILWHERWLEALDQACRLYNTDLDREDIIRILEPLHVLLKRGPETLKERAFENAYGQNLQEAQQKCRESQKTGDIDNFKTAMDLYQNVYRRLTFELPSMNSLELQKVSPRLLNCKDLELAVPGTYAPKAPLICISSVGSQLQVIGSKQRPRKLCIRGSNGKDFYYLLKGHEDLRLDERVMQLFGLVNTLLISNPDTFRRDLTIQRYAVIPLSTNSGLIEFVPHCDTLHTLIKEWREGKKILSTIEHKIMKTMAPPLETLTLMQKVEVFEYALKCTQGDDLAKVLWYKSPSSEVWFERRTNYIHSLAVMSMVGYVLGLGDRHPSNLMLDQQSGKIIHVDFGDCFEVAMTREKYPERIPFRLTRMLIFAMEITGIDGTYRFICETVMSLLRRNKDSLMAMLEAFVYDPLFNWLINKKTPALPPTTDEDSESSDEGRSVGMDSLHRVDLYYGDPSDALNKKAVEIVNRVRDKLTGRDFNHEEALDVSNQVTLLIAQATSHENLSQGFIGWCPFW